MNDDLTPLIPESDPACPACETLGCEPGTCTRLKGEVRETLL